MPHRFPKFETGKPSTFPTSLRKSESANVYL
jgi:hypothetical protein